MKNQPTETDNKCCSNNSKNKKGALIFWAMILIISVSDGLTKIGILTGPMVRILVSVPAILVYVAIVQLCFKRWRSAMLVGYIGIFFWLPYLKVGFPDTLGFLPSRMEMQYFWPLLIGVIALIMILQTIFPTNKTKYWKEWNGSNKSSVRTSSSDDSSNYFINNVSFSSSERILFSNQFKGSNIKVAFGGQELDLRNVSIEEGFKPDLHIEVFMGGCEVIIPPHWFVEVKASTFMGGISARRNPPLTKDTPHIIISGSCFMGGIDIK